jgi:alkaline phosphatase
MFFRIMTALMLLCSCATPRAKNAIYFIGDGMGPTHVVAGRHFKGGPTATLAMEGMERVALVKTYSTDDYVTDSAAAATTLSSGVKTYNASIGMTDPKSEPTGKSRELETLLDLAKAAGKSVGLVTTTRITHATPGAFYAHAKHRDEESLIASQLLSANVDIILGGGRMFFLPKESGGAREDGKNLLRDFESAGYQVYTDYAEFEKNPPAEDKKVIALFEADSLPFDVDRKQGELSISELTAFAIERLSENPKGYFLMVEGARIDHASHYNSARRAFGDVVAMDNAIDIALALGKNETLVVVTADHETGGLALNGYASHAEATGDAILKNKILDFSNSKLNHGLVSWGTGPGFNSSYAVDDKNIHNHQHKATYWAPSAHHSAADVPLMASGPGSHAFGGFMNNSEIAPLIAKAMGLKFKELPQ